MGLVTTTNMGSEQRLELFEQPLREEDLEAAVTGIVNGNGEIDNCPEAIQQLSLDNHGFRVELEKLLDGHKKVYEGRVPGSVYIPNWQEAALVLHADPSLVLNGDYQVDPKNLELLVSTTFHVQAVRKSAAKDVIALAVEALVLTSDNKFVYGIRGGNVENSKSCIAPAGTVLYNHLKNPFENNPLFATLFEELEKELGILTNEVDGKPLLIGCQTDPDFTKQMNYVWYLRTALSSADLERRHEEAVSVYLGDLKSGATELEARKKLRKSNFPNKDAWEHTRLVFVENHPKAIDKIITARAIEVDGKPAKLLDIGRGPLIMYTAIPKEYLG